MKFACVYCGKVLIEEWSPCCGEVGHTEPINETDDEESK